MSLQIRARLERLLRGPRCGQSVCTANFYFAGAAKASARRILSCGRG